MVMVPACVESTPRAMPLKPFDGMTPDWYELDAAMVAPGAPEGDRPGQALMSTSATGPLPTGSQYWDSSSVETIGMGRPRLGDDQRVANDQFALGGKAVLEHVFADRVGDFGDAELEIDGDLDRLVLVVDELAGQFLAFEMAARADVDLI